ncbi:MAG: FecR domain-containing protein [Candidatus Promineofilum sp.]|nr:FecR domain-containing protein [Promineifilum sp.]MBP9657835.1 FecR domain-containing protein [Promineifilum sp.]
MTDSNRYGRQWLAWIILTGSFLSCIILGIAVPLGINAILQNSTESLSLTVQANQGTVGIEETNGPRRAVLVGEPALSISDQTTIRTDTTASALMIVAPPDQELTLATLQVSSNSTVLLERADTPRFTVSDHPHRLAVDLQAGRVRVDVSPWTQRPLELVVTTPQGGIVSVRDPGRYMFEVSNDATQVTVQISGKATVAANGGSLEVGPGQRAEVLMNAAPSGPLDPARDLIHNGDFSEGLGNWAAFSWRVELPDQPTGETIIQSEGGDPFLRFRREGIGHADVRVTQSINQDVSDYESLRLLATLRIVDHSLGVCGIQGSECPLFLIVNYIDDTGVARVWQHGFFANGTVDDNLTPGQCISCAVVQRPHERVPLGQLYFYEVNLIQEMASQGALPPRYIESVTIVGSGHSFVTDILDVALIVE